MKKIGILILLLPVCVFADVGFHPKESNVFFSPETNNNLLDFNLLQISDKSDTAKETSTSYKYRKEAIGGLLGGVLGGFPGGILLLVGNSKGSEGYVVFGGALGLLGGMIGVSTGVGIAGKKMGENGSYRKTFLGTLIGTLLGLYVGGSVWHIIGDQSVITGPIVGGIVGSIFPIAGAVWGYNL